MEYVRVAPDVVNSTHVDSRTNRPRFCPEKLSYGTVIFLTLIIGLLNCMVRSEKRKTSQAERLAPSMQTRSRSRQEEEAVGGKSLMWNAHLYGEVFHSPRCDYTTTTCTFAFTMSEGCVVGRV